MTSFLKYVITVRRKISKWILPLIKPQQESIPYILLAYDTGNRTKTYDMISFKKSFPTVNTEADKYSLLLRQYPT